MLASKDGVRFDPDRMEGERLYHCMFGGRLVLVFKDSQDFVHCYEVEDPEILAMAESAPPGGIGAVLEGYIANTLNKKPPGAGARQLDESRDAEEILSEFASKRKEHGCGCGGHGHGAGHGSGRFDVVKIAGAQSSGERPGAQSGDQCCGGTEPERSVVQQGGEQAGDQCCGGTEPERPGVQQGGEQSGDQCCGGTEPERPVVQQGGEQAAPGGDGGQDEGSPDEKPERNVIFVGTKPIMTYVNATLQQMASYQVVTIKARGKRITQAVDVSQMIVKRMKAVGYTVSDVRISSDSLKSQDGRERNVSTIELDIARS